LIYDHRAHGESEGKFGTAGILEKQDLMLITNYFATAMELDMEKVAWVGESWGAATALQGAVETDNLAFILADSPYQDWYSAVSERAIRDYGAWIEYLVPSVFGWIRLRTGVNPYDASPLEAAASIEVPVLLIHSQTDQATSSSQSVAISQRLNQVNCTFHHTDWGSLHCQDVKDHPEKYGQLIDQFLREKLPDWGLQDSTNMNLNNYPI
jgi:dipeptidyl aminopeptidase/acylaminoacyl peptidase